MSEFIEVETEYGRVKGDKRTTAMGIDYCRFESIPYMKAPLGNLRFKSPVPPEKWSHVHDATKDCPSYVIAEFATFKITGQEDAGVINVYTKNTAPEKLYPVMVYIHGGGFETGTSSSNENGCDYILQKDVILVTFNYRVGVVGFLSLDDESLEVPGNAGLKDQTLALKWIKNNISAFGGDSNNITIFGTSAGGASVHYHLIADCSKNLFNRALAMSGTAFNTSWALHPRRNYPERIAKNLGYEGEINDKDILKFLEEADAGKLVVAAMDILTPEEIFGEQRCFNMGPVIEPYITEDTFIPKHPILMAREAWSKDIDVIFGATSNEGLFMNYFINQDERFLTYFRNSAYFTPLLDLNLQSSDEKAMEIGKKVKKNYYGYTMPAKSNKQGYFLYSSDHEFWNGIFRAVLSRLHSGGKGKTFLYRFDILTELNYLRKIFGNAADNEGVEHGACFGYLFKLATIPVPDENSIEYKCIERVVDVFTSFAINHDFDGTNYADWKPTTVNDLKAYELNNEGCQFVEIPENERFKDWIEIYRDANVDLY